ncbi:HD-GYP domain-containing protein [Clostridium sp. CS001]|uniref:HD-GYP domain-containing protein n=1 Tax=Clostridium sp. CS001 TaxID=2880648 RepID=UPI001CF1000C|nr:HD-GYP domain-containing protein [Clostridium sp. CS001]MCB2288667.1 HD-GYP domain-containing protein [Clostridium sp. CS001]
MLSKKVLPINTLQAGMISSMDISVDGTVLLAKGVAITQQMISKLKQNYIIDKVEVYLDDNSSEASPLKVKTAEELEGTFNEFSSNLENIFENISTLKNPEITEIQAFSHRIQEEFSATGMVIRNIVTYGSGSNSIYRHSVNVAAISFILGKWVGLNEKDLNLLTYSAILHDFGKMKISMDIIGKEPNLTPKELETFRTHPVIGYHFVKEIPYVDASVGLAVLMHHERLDGSGYPLQAKGDKISKFARIIAIADLFDKANSNRHSETVKGPLGVLKLIQDESITKLDSTYCNMFLNHIVNYYMGENVILNDQRVCKIIQVHINDLTKPTLLDDNGFLDLKKEKDLYVEKLVI